MIKTVIRITAALGLVAGMVAVASPALADPPPLPNGAGLYTLPCPQLSPGGLMLMSMDPATGDSTEIGTGSLDSSCSYDPDWNPVTHTAYGMIDVAGGYSLATVDLSTGVFTEGPIITSDGTHAISVGALAIGIDGAAYVTYYDQIYSLNLGTGIATLLGTLPNVGDVAGSWGFGVDPATGKFYLLRQDGVLFLVNPLALDATEAGTFPFSPGTAYSYGFTIDASGTAWVVTNVGGPDHESELWSAPLSDFGSATESGPLFDITHSPAVAFYSFTAFVTYDIPAEPVAVLANTGVDAVTPALGAGLLALLGAALLVMARVRTRATANVTAHRSA